MVDVFMEVTPDPITHTLKEEEVTEPVEEAKAEDEDAKAEEVVVEVVETASRTAPRRMNTSGLMLMSRRLCTGECTVWCDELVSPASG